MLRRRLMGVFSLLSLILCGATLILWARSHHTADAMEWDHDAGRHVSHQRASCRSERGELLLSYWRGSGKFYRTSNTLYVVGDEPPELTLSHWDPHEDERAQVSYWHEAGFAYDLSLVRNASGAYTGIIFGVPHWFLGFVLLLPLAFGRICAVSRRGKLAGLCPSCGYDLRATPSRCPECNWREAEGTAK